MLYSKLEHVVNFVTAPVRYESEHLFVSAGLDSLREVFKRCTSRREKPRQ